MKIHLINQSKLKITFDLKDLEENNISLHSFLSGSKDSKKFLNAIIEIAHEDFGFCIENQKFCYETFCFNYSEFIILVSSQNSTYNLDSVNIQPPRDNLLSDKFSFNFIDNKLSNVMANQKNIYYFFTNLEDFFEFSNYAKIYLKQLAIKTSLYKYKNIYFLEIHTNNLSNSELQQLSLFSSEIKSNHFLSEIIITRFKEFSELLIPDNALNF